MGRHVFVMWFLVDLVVNLVVFDCEMVERQGEIQIMRRVIV